MSLGHALDVPWTSPAYPLDVPWTPLGFPLDVTWTSLGCPLDVLRMSAAGVAVAVVGAAGVGVGCRCWCCWRWWCWRCFVLLVGIPAPPAMCFFLALEGFLKYLIPVPRTAGEIRLPPPRRLAGVRPNCIALAILTMAMAVQLNSTPVCNLGSGSRIFLAIFGAWVSFLRSPPSAKKAPPEAGECQKTHPKSGNYNTFHCDT